MCAAKTAVNDQPLEASGFAPLTASKIGAHLHRVQQYQVYHVSKARAPSPCNWTETPHACAAIYVPNAR